MLADQTMTRFLGAQTQAQIRSQGVLNGAAMVYLLSRRDRPQLVGSIMKQHFNISDVKQDCNTILQWTFENQEARI